MISAPHGFWIHGPVSRDRRLVCATSAFAGFASCEPAALTGGEHYLSAFNFGEEMRTRIVSGDTLDVTGYEGVCGSIDLWWDIDREMDLQAALGDTRALCLYLVDQCGVPEDDLLVFHSGSKGFHVGVPTALWRPTPSPLYHRVSRKVAEGIATNVGIVIDTGVYDRVRAFRAPNSRHPKTGLHKRGFSVKELLALDLPRLLEAAKQPLPFEVPAPRGVIPEMTQRWHDAEQAVAAEMDAYAKRRTDLVGSGGATLNRLTLDIIRTGLPLVEGDRHRLLYSAARNLAECGCDLHLAIQLLTEHGLDSGLAPKEVRRQIECGFKDHLQRTANG